ncbi:MAG: hypothetical protein MUD08_09405 [Cytophagales bacterium]|jgi:hypothetical protein|nr:hypothetical protein [Cytophagales bacterium]
MCRKTAVSTDRQEVFRTEHGCVCQSDAEKAIYIEFGGKFERYDVHCFQRLKKAIFRIDLEQMATDVARATDVEIIALKGCTHFYVLTLPQVLAFRELLEGASVMFELNSIIQERLYTHPAYAVSFSV